LAALNYQIRLWPIAPAQHPHHPDVSEHHPNPSHTPVGLAPHL